MIDHIKNKLNNLSSSGNSAERAESKKPKVKIPQVNLSKPEVEIEKGKVSQFISNERIKQMAKEPPIDKESTSRIKNAIASGSYPIDLDKIADALFDAYKEMKD